jgi:hypothetical protein
MFFLHGDGKNGKGTLIGVWEHILGLERVHGRREHQTDMARGVLPGHPQGACQGRGA